MKIYWEIKITFLIYVLKIYEYTVESRYNAVVGVQETGRVISGSRYSGTDDRSTADGQYIGSIYGHAKPGGDTRR